jgi:hypothetical protein
MIRYLLVGASSGILFGILDAIINANPLARRIYAVYKPIANTSVNIPLGVSIDIVHGLAMAAAFLLLYGSLPGQAGLLKGINFALLIWFFRFVMCAASQWMMFNVPPETMIYSVVTGLGQMLIISML